MPDSPPDGQPSERPEAVLQQQIANIRDPVMREKLETIIKNRDALMKANEEARDKTFTQEYTDQLRDSKVARGHGLHPPGFAPVRYQGAGGFQRATDDARAQTERLKIEGKEADAKAFKAFNEQADRLLDGIYGRYRPEAEKTPPAQAARMYEPVLRGPMPPAGVSPNQPPPSSTPPPFNRDHAREYVTARAAQPEPQAQQQSRPPAFNPQHARQETGPARTAPPSPARSTPPPSPSPKQAPAAAKKREQVNKPQQNQQARTRGRQL